VSHFGATKSAEFDGFCFGDSAKSGKAKADAAFGFVLGAARPCYTCDGNSKAGV
jgi:hypothetical protein